MSDENTPEKDTPEKTEKQPRVVNMKCRRGSHDGGMMVASSADDGPRAKETCTNNRAEILSDLMNVPAGHTVYRCTECGFSWSVSSGNRFPY